jgi:hypothetical protein
MLDHYYDKLLAIVATVPPKVICNEYLETQLRGGAEPLLKVCVEYGQTGEVPLQYLESLVVKHGMQLPLN